MIGDRDLCCQAGCDDYVTKPIDRKILLATVARYVRSSSGDAAEKEVERRHRLSASDRA